ncbi:MAG: NAD(P)/FAD-dependent oxidoreductase [Thaumarchaeota archaeon]|nr:NAD(P)/FAD-dependent oxidoreductase [Nitrososphaerota archaeon]MDE1831236.1 NAD(P)/FAD-dependent oxidoreductase [Nitrososphaerota archaeon]MDE1877177.1 NAD(P)/FAD-dependent oxidoreductase [Nitrososphaerota archaeon]
MIRKFNTNNPAKTKILILGGGFAGSNVLREMQKQSKRNDVEITLVSQDNFFLFTPMLPEVSSGMLHASDITTPIRSFCKTANFCHAKILSIDIENKHVSIIRIFDQKETVLEYDYLVLALGSKDNFFGNINIEEFAFTIKTLEDAIAIRNHIISVLECADQERDQILQEQLLRFVVVGGGFAGVEIATEIHHFLQDATKNYYKNIDSAKIRTIIVSAREGILPEVGEELGKFALDHVRKSGIEVITNTKAVDAGEDHVLLSDNTIIPCATLIWAGGVTVDPLISTLRCEHGQSGRLVVDQYMRLKDYPSIFALGDCANLVDSKTNIVYPTTAQIAIRQAKLVSENLIAEITGTMNSMKPFLYHNKGVMATIGKRTGVALLNGRKIYGFTAWLLWRSFYWTHLPTREKKIKVGFDWFLSLIFRADIMTVGFIKKKTLSRLETPIYSAIERGIDQSQNTSYL